MRGLLLLAFCLALAAPAAVTSAPVESQRPAEDGRLMPPEKVADHIWVMRQPDRLWAAVIGNVTIVEQSDGFVLIDSGGSVADGREVVEAVAKLGPKPIKAVAITHWHNDHPLGLPAIVERYPNVRIISTPATAAFLKSETNVGIGAPDAALNAARRERTAKSVADLRTEAGDPATSAALREQLLLEARWIDARIERLMANYVVMPTETFTDRLVIEDSAAPVELLYLGVGNTHGDLVAWMPKQRTVVTGDIVVLPTPYGFTMSTKPWLETIARIEALAFTTLIPGHGAVQRDRTYLETLKWSMRDIADEARQAAADPALTKEKAFEQFDRAAHVRRFAATDEWSKKWLSGYWLEGMFQTAFEEARGTPASGK